MMRGSSGARGIVGARMVREAQVAERERELAEAMRALARWERQHDVEYKALFWRGERAELNALDAEWNVLNDEVELAREAVREAREAPSW